MIEDVRDSVEDYLASVGLSEVMTYSFIHPCSFDKLELPADDERRRFIEVMNPISDEFKVMRTTLVPSILSTVAYNWHVKVKVSKFLKSGALICRKRCL